MTHKINRVSILVRIYYSLISAVILIAFGTVCTLLLVGLAAWIESAMSFAP